MSFIRACFKSRRLRWLAVVFTALFLAFAVIDYCFETRGLPESLHRKIEKMAEVCGYKLEIASIHAGVWNGIVCTDVRVSGGPFLPDFSANRVCIDFVPTRIFMGILLPFIMEIEQGTGVFPLFPEYGDEGLYDRLVISNVNASLAGAPGVVKVSRAEGSLNGIRFSMRGTVNNLLHYSGAMLFNALFNSSDGDKKSTEPVVLKAAYDSFIKSVPVAMRRKILYTLQRLHEKNFSMEPECEVEFHADLTDFEKSTAKVSLKIQEFTYGDLKIKSITEESSLKDGVFSLDQIRVDLGDGTFITASGKYDGTGNAANGNIKGQCRVADIILMLDAAIQEDIGKNAKIGNEIITFDGTLENFNLASRSYHGKLNVHLPHIKIQNLDLNNVSLSVTAKGRKLEGVLLNASMNDGSSIHGKFHLDEEKFEAQLDGTANAENLLKILSPEIAALVRENVRLSTPAYRTDVAFNGKLGFPVGKIKEVSGEFRIRLTDLHVKDIELKSLASTVGFTTSAIQVRDMEALMPDGSKVTGHLFCEPESKYIMANVICTGSPGNMLSAFGKSNKEFVASLMRDITWPSAANTVEITADLYADYSKDFFYFLTGSMVMRDFSYQKIPFRYGAARFIIDAENRLILPDAILETAEGQMRISAAYKPSGKDLSFKKPDGILVFRLSSSIIGNQMIKSIYPEWTGEYIDFPYPMKVDAHGEINYADENKTRFEALISNGACRWQDIRIDDIDSTLKYENNTVSFRGGEARFSGGRLQMDYLYNFNTEKGRIDARLSSANVFSILENFKVNAGKNSEEYKNATLTMNFNADMSYNDKEELLLHGGGDLDIHGANLWTVPILGSFLRIIGKAWSLDSFGAITRIAGDFKMNGEALEFKHLRSNGGFVSLDASGAYKWLDNSFDVRVRAELLRNALPFAVMSRLLTPVSWIMEKRLKGNFNTYNWE